jgi:hypothetical protein
MDMEVERSDKQTCEANGKMLLSKFRHIQRSYTKKGLSRPLVQLPGEYERESKKGA